MLYTTNLISVTRQVNVMGFIENHATFISDSGDKVSGIMSNDSISNLLNDSDVPLTLECDEGDIVKTFKITNSNSQLKELLMLDKCPACKGDVVKNHCKAKGCKGRRVDNFEKSLRYLGVLSESNKALLIKGSSYDPAEVLNKRYNLDAKESDSNKVKITDSIIDSVRAISRVPFLIMLGRICSLNSGETEWLIDKVDTEAVLSWIHLEDYSEYPGIGNLIDYLNSPFSDWLAELDVIYR